MSSFYKVLIEIITIGIPSSIMAGAIFYYFIEYLPRRKKQAVIINNLEHCYVQFKEKCIQEFLCCIDGSVELKNIEKLKDPNNFYEYFTQNNRKNWYSLLNNFDEINLGHLMIEYEILRDEIRFVINSISVDKETFIAFKRIQRVLYRFRDIDLHEDSAKPFWRDIWSTFTGWNYINGNVGDDYIQSLIDKLK